MDFLREGVFIPCLFYDILNPRWEKNVSNAFGHVHPLVQSLDSLARSQGEKTGSIPQGTREGWINEGMYGIKIFLWLPRFMNRP